MTSSTNGDFFFLDQAYTAYTLNNYEQTLGVPVLLCCCSESGTSKKGGVIFKVYSFQIIFPSTKNVELCQSR